MPFLDEVDDMKAKTPLGGASVPVVTGIAALAVLVAVLAALGIASSARGDFTVEKGASPSSAASGASWGADAGGDAAGAGSVLVYVVGEVASPGVYEVPSSGRVNDAVQAAGGLTERADAASVNLARSIVDGEQIVIPAASARDEGASGGPGIADAGAAAPSPAAAGVTADGKVNINLATSEELQTLPGVGEATAAKIVADRDAQGPFRSKEDLRRVSGIGEKKYAALADSITV